VRIAVRTWGVALAGITMVATSSCTGTSKRVPPTTAKPAELTAAAFSSDFSAMTQLNTVAGQGKGSVAVLLPGSQSRFAQFDGPYFTRALKAAGLAPAQFAVENAQGSAHMMETQAQAAIANGASVLIVDAVDSVSGVAIADNAQQHGVKIVDYDRLTTAGRANYYVTFDDITVGKLIGEGEQQCVTAWKVTKPRVLEMTDASDANGSLVAEGYNSILNPLFSAGTYSRVADPPGTTDEQSALTLFERQFRTHPNINAVVAASDTIANAVITALKSRNVAPMTVPTTGQGATLQGMRNILSGYQCMSAYRPIYLEAQAAVALTMFLRAGQAPPPGLANSKTIDGGTVVLSTLLDPISVTAENMASTVIKDGAVNAVDLCLGSFASLCKQRGIN
jgi:D-xylose transport system substrate-binding protein